MWLVKREPMKFITINTKGDSPVFYCKRDELSTPEFIGDLVSITVRATAIINSLAWAMDAGYDMKKLDMSLYTKDDFPRCGMTFNWQRAWWKYDMKDLNAKTKKVKVNGKDVTDREELNNFLRDVIKDINSYLQKIYWEESGEEFIDRIDKEMENKEKELDKILPSETDDLPFS